MNIPRDQLGEVLHTALRKGCDSKWSSLMWSMVHSVDVKIWDELLNVVDRSFQDNGVTVEALRWAFEEFDYDRIMFNRLYNKDRDAFDHYKEMDRRLRYDNETQWRFNQNFDIVVNMLPEEDAKGIMSFLEYCFREEETVS